MRGLLLIIVPSAVASAFAFRKEDVSLAREFNRHLKAFLGTPEHPVLVRRFGITEGDLPAKNLNAATLCEAEHTHLAATQ